MSPAAWEQLAIQAPIVMIFAGAIYLLMRDQARNTEKLTDKFMAFMDKRDQAINRSLEKIADCLDKHDDMSRAHDAYTRERWGGIEKKRDLQ